MPDNDGYPTEAELQSIRDWPISGETGAALYAACRALLEFVRSIWWAADWGWEEFDGKDDDKPARVYYVSTGGWSGNEEILQVLREHFFFWSLCWHSHRRGGHYTFIVPRGSEPSEIA